MTDIINTPFTWTRLENLTTVIRSWIELHPHYDLPKNLARHLMFYRDIVLYFPDHDMGLVWRLDPTLTSAGLDYDVVMTPYQQDKPPIGILNWDFADKVYSHYKDGQQVHITTEDVIKALKHFELPDVLLELCIQSLNEMS